MTTTEPSSDGEEPARENDPAILIRKATAADAVPMWRVHTAAVRSLSGGVYTPEQIQAWIEDDLPETYRRDMSLGKAVFVAEQHGRVIGFSCLCGTEVEALYVDPSYAHHNAGQLLLTALERAGSIHHARNLSLDAALNAVDFYRARGYRVLGYSAPAFDSGRVLPCMRMGKTLGTGARRDVPDRRPLAQRRAFAAAQT